MQYMCEYVQICMFPLIFTLLQPYKLPAESSPPFPVPSPQPLAPSLHLIGLLDALAC